MLPVTCIQELSDDQYLMLSIDSITLSQFTAKQSHYSNVGRVSGVWLTEFYQICSIPENSLCDGLQDYGDSKLWLFKCEWHSTICLWEANSNCDSIESLAFVHSVLCETRFRRYFCYWNYSSVFCRCRISVVFLLLGSIENRKAKSLFVSREPIPMGNWLWLGYESTVCWQCRD